MPMASFLLNSAWPVPAHQEGDSGHVHDRGDHGCDEMSHAMSGGRLREFGYYDIWKFRDVWKFREQHVILNK